MRRLQPGRAGRRQALPLGSLGVTPAQRCKLLGNLLAESTREADCDGPIEARSEVRKEIEQLMQLSPGDGIDLDRLIGYHCGAGLGSFQESHLAQDFTSANRSDVPATRTDDAGRPLSHKNDVGILFVELDQLVALGERRFLADCKTARNSCISPRRSLAMHNPFQIGNTAVVGRSGVRRRRLDGEFHCKLNPSPCESDAFRTMARARTTTLPISRTSKVWISGSHLRKGRSMVLISG
jgi:hypothetical protein